MAPRGAGGFEDGEHEVDFKVNFRADLEWIDGRCGIDFGSIWNQCGVHLGSNLGSFGVHFGINLGSMSKSRRDQIFGPLDRFWSLLGPHVGPMLAPCWQLLGVLGHLGGFLSDSEPILRRF